ncbi:unnamed protein product [Trifolium pratense]|uniref:Uncharacterized protein n=1 Tax=Trifolium pratense TaxID=57577 RepID=A0ACB0JVZ4_TRIPR|nr:unnamed protein product [Trifolium pratense]
MTLDDVSCLLHLPLGGRLLDHTSLTKDEGITLIVDLLGSDAFNAHIEVTKAKCAHVRTTYLKEMFKDISLR